MRLRDQVALTLPTLFLRIVLGITFLWAGTGKLMGTYAVTGNDAARLANIGVMPAVPTLAADPTTITEPVIPDSPTDEPADDQSGVPVDESTSQPTGEPTGEPVVVPTELNEQANEIIEMIEEQLDPPAQPAEQPSTDPVKPADKVELQSVQYTGTVYAAADFPDPMEVKQVYSIALMISKSADPGLTQDSAPIEPTMPAMLASRPWPKALAWIVAITEIVAGAFLVLGLLTRISALGTLSIMLVALWMTQFGPAVIQTNDAILGFIPRYDDPWSGASYAPMFWQLALAAMSLSVFFLGSGAIGIDRLLFKPAHRDPYLHGDPKSNKNIKATPPAPQPDRTAFDRTPNPTP